MKYIDSEKLTTIIEERKAQQDQWINSYHEPINKEISQELTEILSIISSLQQEQLEGLHFTPLNRLIQKIPSKNWNDAVNNYAKKLRDCLIKEGYLKDANVLQGYISYMNGNNVPMATMDEQEQPEVNLEKEIDEQWDRFVSSEGERKDFNAIARHFYELGLKARKEE